jgi:hypothetical protein
VLISFSIDTKRTILAIETPLKHLMSYLTGILTREFSKALLTTEMVHKLKCENCKLLLLLPNFHRPKITCNLQMHAPSEAPRDQAQPTLLLIWALFDFNSSLLGYKVHISGLTNGVVPRRVENCGHLPLNRCISRNLHVFLICLSQTPSFQRSGTTPNLM